MEKLLWVVMAGGVGTAARYGIVTVFGRFNAADSFPWAIFTANMVGCYLFGMVWQAAEGKTLFNDHVRLAILVGFMGAFTTFSTFAFDNAQLVKASRWGALALNLALNNGVGLAMVFARVPNVASPLAIGQIAALKITKCRGVSHVTLSPTCHPEGSRRV